MTELAVATALLALALVLSRRALRDPAAASLFDVGYLAVGLFFGGGYWLAAMLGKTDAALALDDELTVLAYAAPALHLAGLWLATWFLGRQPPLLAAAPGPERCAWVLVLAAFLAGWAFRVIQVFVYGVLPSLEKPEENFSPPYLYMVALQLTGFLMRGCMLWSSIALFSRRMRSRALPALILVPELFWSIVTSRRDAVLWMVTLLLGYLASGRRVRAGALAAGAAGAVVLTQVVLPWIPAMRAVYVRAEGVGAAVSEVLRHGLSTFKAEETENLASRPLNLRTFIADIANAQPMHEPMRGRAMARSVSGVVPAVIWSSKETVSQTEETIQEHHGLPLVDTAISWPAVAVADFGVAGCLPYGIGLGVLLIALTALVRRVSAVAPFLSVSLLSGLLYFMFHVEQDPLTLWVTLRSFALLAVPVLIRARLAPQRVA